MGIDPEKFYTAAVRGDVSGVAIKVVLSLEEICRALEQLHAGEDPKAHIAKLREYATDLSVSFDRLTGWVPDDR